MNAVAAAPARERGVALLLAMLILALGVSITSAILWDRSLAVHRSAMLQAQRQAYFYDLGAESWVEQILNRDRGKNDTLGSDWAQHLPPLPVQGGALQGHVTDLQGRFNVNDLVGSDGRTDAAALHAFRRLLAVLGLDPNIASAVADWVDTNDQVTAPGGAESGYYAVLNPPYAPADAPLVSVTTLRLVRGVTPAVYARLAPYVSALPVRTPVNVNTASAAVLVAVIPGLDMASARRLVSMRGKRGFGTLANLQQLAHRKTTFPLSLKSQFFLLQVTTSIGSTRLSMYSVLYRNDQGTTLPIARSFLPI